MTNYFCASTFGFYQSDVHEVIPDDKVELEQSYYEELISCAERGQYIAVDDTGYPILKDVADIPITAEQNKNRAVDLLQQSDWVEYPSVRNTQNTPHLVNLDEFDQYRLTLRAIAISPTEGDIDWPVIPEEVWG